MAQKRMFDRAILDTDKFMDLPMSSKAIYFLLGMEADDEGFVSPKKVLKIHGGSDDDIKVLIAKKFLIPFQSGVVVITDWMTNNYLDKNRIKPTQYIPEKHLLTVVSIGTNRNSNDKKYILTDDYNNELNNGLTGVKLEEKRREEKRREENYFSEEKLEENLEKPIKKQTPTFTPKAGVITTDYDVVPTNADGDEVSPRKKVDWSTELAMEERFVYECVKRNLPKPGKVPLYYLARVKAGIKLVEESELPAFFDWWFTNGFPNSLLNVHSAFSTASVNRFRGRGVVQSKQSDPKYSTKVKKI